MFQEFFCSEKIDMNDWLDEIKSEIAQKVNSQAAKYNFNFSKCHPKREKGMGKIWTIDEKEALGVGKLRKIPIRESISTQKLPKLVLTLKSLD